MIYFKDSTHEYVNERGEKYTSVSSLWSKYKNEFDKEKWSNYKAIEAILGESSFKTLKAQYSSIEAMLKDVVPQMDPAVLEPEVKRILQKWSSGSKDAINKGNLYHSSMEKKVLITGVVINPFTQTGFKVVKSEKVSGFDNESISMNLFDLKDGFYPELLIWSDKYLIAGQSDKVFITTEKGVRYVDIDDYKTNKEIKTRGFKGEKMKKPLHHLDDCNFNHYALAISLYAYMLELVGYKVRNTGLHHFNKLMTTPYLKKEVKAILEEHIKKPLDVNSLV